MINIIDRYFLSEQLKPFVAGVMAFMIIMISNTLYIFMDMIVKNGIDTWTVVQMLLYNLPAIVVVTLPVAYMFATLLALGRLGRDSEIIALRACGVSLPRCIMPIIIMSVAISALGFWMQENVVPWANQQTVEVIKNMMRRDPIEAIQEKKFLNSDKRSFFVNEKLEIKVKDKPEVPSDDAEKDLSASAEPSSVPEASTEPRPEEETDETVSKQTSKSALRDVYVIDKTKAGYPQMISAESAARKDTKWELTNGMVRKLDELGFIDHEIRFQRMEIEMDIKPEKIFTNTIDVRQMASSEARDFIEEEKKKGKDTSKAELDLHTKYSLPLATFFTILLAAPIGIKFSKLGNYFGVAISIALVFVWYVLYSTFTNLGQTGAVIPVLAAWVQNIVFGGLGLVLLIQMSGLNILWPLQKLFKLIFFPVYMIMWLLRRRSLKREKAKQLAEQDLAQRAQIEAAILADRAETGNEEDDAPISNTEESET